MTLFNQRLIKDRHSNSETGLNYDYMGAAEYEFGATRDTRIALANANELVTSKHTIRDENSFRTTFQVTAIYPNENNDEAMRYMKVLESGKYRNKGGMNRDDTLGWLVTHYTPILIVKNLDGVDELATKFLNHTLQNFRT